MRQIFKIFFRSEFTRPWLVLACLIVAGIVEAFGVGTLLPILNTLAADGQQRPSGVENIVNRVFVALNLTPGFGALIGFILLLFFVRSLLLFGAVSYVVQTGVEVSARLRNELMKAVFRTRWSFFVEHSGGNLATTLTTDATNAATAYQVSAECLAALAQVTAYGLMALLVDWRVALSAAAGGAVIALVSSWLVGQSRKQGYKFTSSVADLSGDMVDTLKNAKAIRAMNREGPLLWRFGRAIAKIKQHHNRIGYARMGLMYGNDFLVAALVCAGAYVAYRFGGAEVSQILVLGIIFLQVVSNISKFQRLRQQAAQNEASYMRVRNLIREAHRLQERHSGTRTPQLGKGCRFDDVTFAHDATPVIANVSLEMPAGNITVLQGPSGAGKTTIIDLLVGLYTPQRGSVLVGQDNLSDLDIAAWRRTIGYVPQELVLFHDTIRENLTLGETSVTDAQIDAALLDAGLKDLIASLPQGLSTDVGEHGSKLSGGQRQRLSLARALVHQPKLLILDEVTSALDPATEEEIVNNIARLRGRHTIVAITHRPAWTAIADRLYEVRAGHVSQVSQKKSKRK